jgi:copper transport protein
MLWDPASPAEAPLYILVRWLSFSAIVLAIGALLFPRVVGGTLRSLGASLTFLAVETATRRVAVAAAIAVAAGALLRVVMQRMALNAAFAPDVIPWRDVVTGTFALGLWLQLAGAALALGATKTIGMTRTALTSLAITAMALGPGMSGHAAAGTPVGLTLAADAAHVLTAGTWVGMLAILLLVAMPIIRAREPDTCAPATRAMIAAFSPFALGSVGLLVASGVFAGWRLVGSWEALFNTRYGAALLAKVALLLVMMGFGALNWRWVGPAAGTPRGLARFRRVSWGELLVAVVVLLVTAALVGRPSPTE